MILHAPSRSTAFRSGIFVRAISSSWARVTVPILSRLGSADPLSSEAALSSSTAAGGVLVMNEYVRSAYTVITTGMISPRHPGFWR